MKIERKMLIAFTEEAVIISQNKFGGVIDVSLYELEDDEIFHREVYIKMMLLEEKIDSAIVFSKESAQFYTMNEGEIVKGRVFKSTIETLVQIFRDYEMEDIQLLDALSNPSVLTEGDTQILYNKQVSRYIVDFDNFPDMEMDCCSNVYYYYEGLEEPEIIESR